MKRWRFNLDEFTRVGETHVFKISVLEAEGETAEEALEKLVVPPGRKIWAYYEVPL